MAGSPAQELCARRGILLTPKTKVLDFPWELYDLRNDWTQYQDVAAKNPAKLKELQALIGKEAEKYQVLPLDTSVVTRMITPRPSLSAGRSAFTWTQPLTGTPNGDAPSLLNTSYNFKAEVEIPQGGADGMLITQGDLREWAASARYRWFVSLKILGMLA